MRCNIGLCFCGTIATAAVVIAAAADVQPSEKAERIVNRSCVTSCHDLRPIQVQALDEQGWTKVVETMIEKGAEVGKEDVPLLVGYLIRHHGPVPDGAGKDILLNTCTLCHDLTRVKEHGGTAKEWQETLIAMINEGAPLSDADFPVLLRYLARNFPPQSP
jgi:cytochrome c5